ncbi:DUF5906 domain-containing protein [Alysiella crassa]|uniref:DNA primase (Bacterial type) n=1 Tax=Alysiella crassa TaxID=153491 RepID=A0A376BTK6_9NEIS|nr:DUF5906 domain-containing protein [Alysiella crassa]SSY80317.1 DNA primase (bacterial type) [Alysiella crassa]
MNNKISKQDIEQAVGGNWTTLLERVGVPNDLLNGKHQPCPNCGGTDRYRYTNHKNSGTWICNQCQPDGASPFDLVMAVYGCSFVEAKELMADALGLSVSENGKTFTAKPLPEPVKKQPENRFTPIVPVPDYALKSMTFFHKYRNDKKGEYPVMKHVFRDEQGRILGGVGRFIGSDGRKVDLPYTFCHDSKTNTNGWQYKCWDGLRPLYGLEVLAQNPDKIVLVVEGEKCKQAAHYAELGVVAVTWHGGCNAWDKSDWSPLAGRRVILWADADSKRIKPNNQQIQSGMTEDNAPFLHKYKQGGMKAMMGVAEKLTELGCDCAFVKLPDVGVLPDGYDITDALEEGIYAKLPPHDILSWQNMGDWLIDFADLKADFARVFAHSEKRSVCADESVKMLENSGAHTQPIGVFAGQTQGENAVNDEEFGNLPPQDNLLNHLLENYAAIGQKEKAINLVTGETLSRRQLEKIFTKDAVLNWTYHKNQRRLPEFEAQMLSSKLVLEAKAKNRDFANILNRYIYLDGTTDAYDIKLDDVVSLAAVKAAIPEEFEDWAKSPARLVCPISNYVFDPKLPVGISYYEDDDGNKNVSYINKFNGFDIEFEKLPEMPEKTLLHEMYPKFSGCQEILGLIWHLCSGNGEVSMRVYRWVLCWLACRLRFPHEKPPTTLVFISEVQGVGKSTFADKVLKGLFTKYYRKLNQNALESRFNSSLKFALMTVFEEIAPSDERMNVIGKLKDMISGETIMIENKGRDVQEFSDFNSYVINSNDARSIPMETNDRRFMTMHCKEKYSEEAHERLMAEIENGGLSVFAEFLHALPLFYSDNDGNWRKFTPHSKPIMTPIKQRMIGLSRQSWEAFYEAWKNGEIENLPFVSCRKKDLWAVYVWWCDYTKTFKMSQDKFFNSIACKFERVYRTQCKLEWDTKKIDVFVLPHSEIDGEKYPEPNTAHTARSGSHGELITIAEYLGKQVVAFNKAASIHLPHLPAL